MGRTLERKEIVQLASVSGQADMQVHQTRHVGRRGRVLDDRLSFSARYSCRVDECKLRHVPMHPSPVYQPAYYQPSGCSILSRGTRLIRGKDSRSGLYSALLGELHCFNVDRLGAPCRQEE